MDTLKIEASKALQRAALNQRAKHYLLQNPILFPLLLKGARRYLGGETLEETIHTIKRLNAKGLPTSVEFMGESVKSREQAYKATQEFLRVIEGIKEEKLNSIVSLDLSHIGLNLDRELALENLSQLAELAKSSNIEIMISAEGIESTDKVLDCFYKISPAYTHIGLTLQAYLHRTPKDLEYVLKNTQGKIRLVKGAFAAPEEYALSRGETLDERYLSLVKRLLTSKRKCSIATHDDKIQQQLKAFIDTHHISEAYYEFEMLYGIREELLEKLMQEGYPCRQYLVYGNEWYLYVCNRIAEYPENLFQFIIDIVE